MQRKVLTVKYPRITCHQSMGSLLSILESLPNTEEWIYSNFIITEAFSYVGGYAKGSVDLVLDPEFDFSVYCPWFWKSELSADTINAFEADIVKFIIKSINTNNYILLHVDESKFSFMNLTDPFYHDIFIYGYDKEAEMFLTADFTFNHGKYTYKQISFADMEKAYKSALLAGKNLNNEGFAILWHLNEDAQFAFDLDLVKDALEEYLRGFSYANRFRRVFHQAPINKSGIDVYSFLREHLEFPGMRKCLHNLYDHKKLMLERIQFLKRKNYICDVTNIENDYRKIVDNTSIAVNLYIKYTITEKRSALEKVADLLIAIEKEEAKVLNSLLKEIKDKNYKE